MFSDKNALDFYYRSIPYEEFEKIIDKEIEEKEQYNNFLDIQCELEAQIADFERNTTDKKIKFGLSLYQIDVEDSESIDDIIELTKITELVIRKASCTYPKLDTSTRKTLLGFKIAENKLKIMLKLQ